VRTEHAAGQELRTQLDARERELATLRAELAGLRDEVAAHEAEVTGLRAELARHEADAELRSSQLERYAADLRETFKQERARAHQLRASYRGTVRALANAVEARDAYTGRHAERVAAFGLAIAEAAQVDAASIPQLEFGFLLHDVGKVAVPDAILFKAGPLTEEEYALVRRHPTTGWEIIREIDFLGDGALVVRHHHERWDGRGYPDGLRGRAIPFAARVFAVADTLDALTTDRPYRRATPFAAARETIRHLAGTQFDPDVVAAYDRVPDEALQELREQLG
jgi:ribonuclease P protein subunit RPR2